MHVLQGETLSVLTFSDDLDVTYLFENEDERESFLSTVRKPQLNAFKSASAWHPLYIRCFSGSYFSGELMFDASDPEDGFTPTFYNSLNAEGFANLANMNGWNFDNKMNSIQILNYTEMEVEINLYENSGFSGRSWTIYVRPSSVNGSGDSNQDDAYNQLKGYSCLNLKNFQTRFAYSTGSWFWYKSFHWDNRVSSMKWRLIECIGSCADF